MVLFGHRRLNLSQGYAPKISSKVVVRISEVMLSRFKKKQKKN